jgi:hypothetical protein
VENQMLASVTHILPLTNIRRTRTLPVPGQVTVRQSANVSATDVVAMANIPSGYMVLDIRRGLGIQSTAAADRCIIRQVGDKLEKGDTIAETSGLFARMVRAPVAGEVVAVGAGQVLLCSETKTVEVQAGFAGTVVEVLPEMGVVIETNGALIQGVWGNGRVDSGMLLMVAHAPDEELTRPAIDVSMRGAVILGGHCSDQDALRAGSELAVRGLILASMSAGLVPYARNLSYPIFVLEGFGKIPMNAAAYKLLTSQEKREVAVNTVYNSEKGEKPEVVITLQAGGQAPPETAYFSVGQKVRVQGVPYTGKNGTIVSLSQGFEDMPNGLRVLAAEIAFEDDTRAVIPLANLEVLI